MTAIYSITHLDPCIEVDGEGLDPLIQESIQDSNSFFMNLTPCSSGQTLKNTENEFETTPEPITSDHFEEVSPTNTRGNDLGEDIEFTIILPDFIHHQQIKLSSLFEYIHASTDAPVYKSYQDLTVHHLITYLFDQILHDSNLLYINQIKLMIMGKAYSISNLVDLAYPASYLANFKLISILSTSKVFQLFIIPKENLLPLKLPIQTILFKLHNIQVCSVDSTYNPTSDFSATYADAVLKTFRKVRKSISSNSSSSENLSRRRSSIKSIESLGSNLSRFRSNRSSGPNHGSDTEIDEIPSSNDSKFRHKLTNLKSIFKHNVAA